MNLLLPVANFGKRLTVMCREVLELPQVKKVLPFLVYLQPLILAILTFAVASRFAPIGVDGHHDGIMFKPALDMAEGKMLFRDTFTQYGAFTYLLEAAALKIFGHYLLVIRLEAAFFYALTVYFLWLVWKRLIPQWLATACGIVFIFMAPYLLDINFINRSPNYGSWFLSWSSVYALFFQVFSLYLLILFIEKRSWRYVAAAGASAALTMWARQPVGALLFLAASFFLVCMPLVLKTAWRRAVTDAALFVSGFAAVNVCFVGWLVVNSAFKDMWLQLVVFPTVWIRHVGAAASLQTIIAVLFPAHDRLSFPPSYVWVALPVICLLLLFRILTQYLAQRSLDTKQLVVFVSVLVCIASWGQYYPILCERHAYWAIAPMIGMFAFFVWDLLAKEVFFYRVAIVILAMVLLFQADITRRIQGGRARLANEYVTLERPKILKGMRMPPHDAVFFSAVNTEIEDYFRRYPGGGFIGASMDDLFPAFVENLTNFHPIQVDWSFQGLDTLYADYRARFEKYAAEKRPIIISQTKPFIYPGYTIKSLGRDIYITAPGDPKSSWHITAFQPVQREFPEPLNPVRNYTMELHYSRKMPMAVRSVVVVTSDFDGVVTGAWIPASQTQNLISLSYTASSSVDTDNPLPGGFSIPEDGKMLLSLAGHDFQHYSTAMKIKVVIVTANGARFQQVLSFLPLYARTPEELLNQSLRYYFAGEFRKCIQAAEASLRLRPDFALAYNNICASYNSLGEWDAAAVAGARAVELDPGNVLAANNLALAKRQMAARRSKSVK